MEISIALLQMYNSIPFPVQTHKEKNLDGNFSWSKSIAIARLSKILKYIFSSNFRIAEIEFRDCPTLGSWAACLVARVMARDCSSRRARTRRCPDWSRAGKSGPARSGGSAASCSTGNQSVKDTTVSSLLWARQELMKALFLTFLFTITAGILYSMYMYNRHQVWAGIDDEDDIFTYV